MPDRPKHTKKAAKKAAAKKVPKRRFYKPEEQTSKKKAPPAASSHYDYYEGSSDRPFIVTLLFWPFLIVNALTRTWPGLLRFTSRLMGYSFILGALLLLVGGLYYYIRSSSYDMKLVAEMPERSIVLDRSGTELGRLHGENRKVVPLSAVSHDFRQALLAREDVRFYDHGAVDLKGLARATFQNIKRGRMAQGASTLTMQLARNSFNLHSGKEGPLAEIDRKLLEIAVANRIEHHYSKDEVFEHYINRIFWGHSIQGIEAASQTYLEKTAKELTLSDAAMLAGIIRGPNAFSPFRRPEKSIRERDTVLKRMVLYNFISQEAADKAMNEVPKIRPQEKRKNTRSYAMSAIGRELDVILEKSKIAGGGLRIKTTLDERLQKAAEKALDSHLTSIENRSGYRHHTRKQWLQKYGSQPIYQRPAPDYLQGGLVMIENKTGGVLATVGGRNANESSFDRARQAKRQVGSIFKPFVFMTAHDRHRSQRLNPRAEDQPIVLPKTWISDEPMQPGEIAGAPLDWIPKNSDDKYYKLIWAQDALVQSRNTSSIRVGSYAGLENVIKTADLAGFNHKKIPRVPASYLGTWEATPWEVASAYTIFPNLGKRRPAHLIQEILDRHGEIVYRAPGFQDTAASPGATWAASHVLQLVVRDGTAKSLHTHYGINLPSGGKTGTTNNYVDGWYAGYTSDLTCAVWVGLDTPKRVMDKGYGSTLALPIWASLMKTASKLGTHPAEDLTPKSLSFIQCRLCQFSAQRATRNCEKEGCAYNSVLPRDLVPRKNDFCTMHPENSSSQSTHTPSRSPAAQAPLQQTLPHQQSEPPQAIPLRPEEIQQALPVYQ